MFFLLIACSIVICGDIFSMKKGNPELERVLTEKKQLQEKKENLQKERLSKSKKRVAIGDDDIIKELKEEGFIPKYAVIEKAFQNMENRLILLNGGNQNDYAGVVKIAPTRGGEYKELMRGLNLVQFVNELRKSNKDIHVPIIVEPRGSLVIGDKTVFVLDRAKGIDLYNLFTKKFNNMSDELVQQTFFNIGEQSGNLDRLSIEKKGGILNHGDSHSENFLFDEKAQQLYWIDTDRSRIEPKILSSLAPNPDDDDRPFLLWFLFMSSPWGLEGTDERKTFEALRKDREEGKIKVESIDSSVISKFENVVKFVQKELLALKSFGEGYVKGYPDGKDAFNLAAQEDNKGWDEIIQELSTIAKLLGLKKPQFIDPIQK